MGALDAFVDRPLMKELWSNGEYSQLQNVKKVSNSQQ